MKQEPRTPEQGALKEVRDERRREAIVLANQQRKRTSTIKKAIKTRLIDDLALVRGDLGEYEWIVARWKVETMLRSCRAIGPLRAQKILEAMNLSPSRKMGELTYERRSTMARLVDEARDILA